MQGLIFLCRGLDVFALVQNKFQCPTTPKILWHYFFIAACAAARRAIGTLKGEQET